LIGIRVEPFFVESIFDVFGKFGVMLSVIMFAEGFGGL